MLPRGINANAAGLVNTIGGNLGTFALCPNLVLYYEGMYGATHSLWSTSPNASFSEAGKKGMIPVMLLPYKNETYANLSNVVYNSNAADAKEKLYEYVVFQDKAYIAKYRGPQGSAANNYKLEMPDQLGGYDVIGVATLLFSNYDSDRANNYLFKEYVLPEKLEVVSAYMFHTLNTATTSFTDVEKITMKNEVKTIEQGAFYGCNLLKYVGFGSKVDLVQANVFEQCTNVIVCTGRADDTGWVSTYNSTMVPIIFSDSSYADPSSNHIVFDSSNFDYIIDGGKIQIARFNNFSATKFVVPATFTPPASSVKDVYGIADYAFKNKTTLQDFIIEATFITRLNKILSGCSGLKNITLPFLGTTRDGIGAGLLTNNLNGQNASLVSVTVNYSAGSSIVIAGSSSNATGAFWTTSNDTNDNFNNLQKITINGPISGINQYAFRNLKSLKYLVINSTLAAGSITEIPATSVGSILYASNNVINI
ncbi:MAG: hypothetical protein EZS28_043941, partial [Streblomastix strix]